MFTSILQNRCSKSIRKFLGKKPQFLGHFSAHFLEQDGCP